MSAETFELQPGSRTRDIQQEVAAACLDEDLSLALFATCGSGKTIFLVNVMRDLVALFAWDESGAFVSRLPRDRLATPHFAVEYRRAVPEPASGRSRERPLQFRSRPEVPKQRASEAVRWAGVKISRISWLSSNLNWRSAAGTC